MTLTRSTVQGRLDELLICCGVLDGEAGKRGREMGRKGGGEEGRGEEGRGGGRNGE